MNIYRCLLACFVLTMFAPILSAQAPAKNLSMVLLANGRLIQGALYRENEWTRVELHSGGEIRLPTDSVRFACQSPEDAYWKQRLQINPRDARAQAELAIWCLNENEEKLAEEQIEICRLAGVAANKLTYMHKRLTLLKASDAPGNAQTLVLPRSAEQPTNEYLDAIHPRRIFEFTQTIQPLLLNHCGATTCHGHRSNNGFQLVRPLEGQVIARKFTLGNLNHLLEQIGQTHDESLEKYVSQPHGGLDLPAITEPAKRQVINDWVRQLREPFEQPVATVVRSPQSFLSQPDTRLKNWRDRDQDETAAAPLTMKNDPFDPDVFNRKYHGENWQDQATTDKPTTPPKTADRE